MGLVASFGLGINGHFQAQNMYTYQPAKIGVYEGHFETGRGDLNIIGWPNEKEERIDFAVGIPGGLSFLLFDDFTFSKPVVGLDRFKKEDRPPLLIPFFSWRAMVGLGSLMIILCGLGVFYNMRGTSKEKRWLLWSFVFAIGLVIVANQSGWISAEVGRQPWTVNPPVTWNSDGTDLITGPDGTVEYDETAGLRTANSVSTAVSPAEALTSLILFIVLYLSLTAVWIFILDRKIRKGPEPLPEKELEDDAYGMRQATIDKQHARLSSEKDGNGGAA